MPRSRLSPFFKRLTETRQTAGLSQVNLARRLGRPQSFVSVIESGERRLDVVEVIEVAERLGRPAVKILKELIELDPLGVRAGAGGRARSSRVPLGSLRRLQRRQPSQRQPDWSQAGRWYLAILGTMKRLESPSNTERGRDA